MTDTTTPTGTTPTPSEPYDLSRYTLISEPIGDRDRFTPGITFASVHAVRFRGENEALIQLLINAGPTRLGAHMSVEKARTLAQALLDAADIVDAFEGADAMAQEAELARFNAGPIRPIGHRVVEVTKGYFAFEPATCNTVDQGGAA